MMPCESPCMTSSIAALANCVCNYTNYRQCSLQQLVKALLGKCLLMVLAFTLGTCSCYKHAGSLRARI